VNSYFRSDDANSRWTVALSMKIGGGSADHGPAGGIHWHMNINNEVSYVSTDTLRQTIPWVSLRNRTTGEVREYMARDAALPREEIDRLLRNVMDCIDCHNRPSHIYRPPVRIVDRSLASGRISTAIPGIRAAAVNALVQPYTSARAATDSIPQVLDGFYREKLGAIPDTLRPLLASASGELTEQFRRNFFPAMKVSWKAYPNNIGHMTDLGCFRCHDGNHVSADGKEISKDCNVCHTILYQGPEQEPGTLSPAGLPFQHPEDIGDAWLTTNCNDCHTGGQ